MATVTLSVQTAQGTVSASKSVSDANVTRAQAAMQVMFPGKNNQQLLDYALQRLLDQVSSLTKSYERTQQPVADIPIT